MNILLLMAATATSLGAVSAGVVKLLGGIEQAAIRIRRLTRLRAKKTRIEPPRLSNSDNSLALNNLPPRREFVGRASERKRILEALQERPNTLSIDGIGGIGKTTLALEVAHTVLHHSHPDSESADLPQGQQFDAVIWTPCNERELTLQRLLSTIARVLDYPGVDELDPSTRQQTVKMLLFSNRCLIILDNFDTLACQDILDFLDELPETSKALITTRLRQPTPFWTISIGGMSASEAVDLMKTEGRRLNFAAIQSADIATLHRLHAATGGVPLIIKWSIGQIKQRGQTIDTLLAILNTASSDIFTTIFARSWSLLGKDSRKLLTVLAVLPSAATRNAAIIGSDLPDGKRFDEAMGQLFELSLVEASDDLELAHRRYRVHPMTRAFALSKLTKGNNARSAIIRRIICWYHQLTNTSNNAEQYQYQEIHAERENILALIRFGFNIDWEASRELPLNLKWFLWENGLWLEIATLCDIGMQAAANVQDHLFLGKYAKEIAWVRCRQGNHEDALAWSAQVTRYWNKCNPSTLDCADQKALHGLLEKEKGNLTEAKSLLMEALQEFDSDSSQRMETLRVLTYLGELERDQGESEHARRWFKETLRRAKITNHTPGIAWSLGNLGDLEFHAGNFDVAEVLLKQGLELAAGIDRYHTIANCSLLLAYLAEKADDTDTSQKYCRLALDKFSRLGIARMVTESRTLLSRLESSTK
jgi:tetratricopeptide (TPR) repeat protein